MTKLQPPNWPRNVSLDAPAADAPQPRTCPRCLRSGPQHLMREITRSGARSRTFVCATEEECRTNRGLHPTIKRPGEERLEDVDDVTEQDLRDADLKRIHERLSGRSR